MYHKGTDPAHQTGQTPKPKPLNPKSHTQKSELPNTETPNPETHNDLKSQTPKTQHVNLKISGVPDAVVD